MKDNSKLLSHRKEEFSHGQFQCEKQDLFRREVSCFRKGVEEGVPKEERPEKMMQVLSFMHHPTEGDK